MDICFDFQFSPLYKHLWCLGLNHKSIAGCENLACTFFPNSAAYSSRISPARQEFPSPSPQTGLDLEGLGLRWGETGKKSLPATCSDICLIFLFLSKILLQLGLGKSPPWPRVCRNLLFILLPTIPHLFWFKSGSCQMIFKEQISPLNGRQSYPYQEKSQLKALTVIIVSHVPVLGALPPFCFKW